MNSSSSVHIGTIANQLFSVSDAVEKLIETCEFQIEHAIENDYIPESAGRITVEVHKSDPYDLRIRNNGTGITWDDMSELAKVGRISEEQNKGESNMWTLAPFLFTSAYQIRSNPRNGDDRLYAHVSESSIERIQTTEDEALGFLGTEIRIYSKEDAVNLVEIGEKLREVAREHATVGVKYEMYDENGGLLQDKYYNI